MLLAAPSIIMANFFSRKTWLDNGALWWGRGPWSPGSRRGWVNLRYRCKKPWKMRVTHIETGWPILTLFIEEINLNIIRLGWQILLRILLLSQWLTGMRRGLCREWWESILLTQCLSNPCRRITLNRKLTQINKYLTEWRYLAQMIRTKIRALATSSLAFRCKKISPRISNMACHKDLFPKSLIWLGSQERFSWIKFLKITWMIKILMEWQINQKINNRVSNHLTFCKKETVIKSKNQKNCSSMPKTKEFRTTNASTTSLRITSVKLSETLCKTSIAR